MFDFFSSLGPYVDMAAKFLFGDDRSPGGEGKNEGAAGFLARTFLDTQGSASERRQEEAIRMDIPKLGTGARARIQGVAQGRPFVGSNNAALQSAIRRGLAGGSMNAQYANLWRQYQSQRTMGSNRRTVGLEAPRVSGATKTKAANVRVMKDTV